MVLSGRDILKFVLFVALVGIIALYVVANRSSLFYDVGSGSPGRPSASDGDREQPVDVAQGIEGGLDLTGAEVIPVGAFDSLAGPPAGSETGELASSAGHDQFLEFRLDREQARSEQLDLLREILDNSNLSQEAHAQALALWLKITEDIGREADIENLIVAKGFADAVVVLSQGKATVMVKAPSLTQDEVLRVADIVVRVAGIGYENITVMAKGG